jgi:carboxypeptidase C (cathepsin A)
MVWAPSWADRRIAARSGAAAAFSVVPTSFTNGEFAMHVRLPLISAAAMCLAGATAAAQRPNTPGGRGGGAGSAAPAQPEGVPAVEKVSTTQHTITIGGKQIAYTSRAGTMVIRGDDGKPRATVFYISNTRDGVDAATRPVTFFYNGGPGSASVWLGMGAMSPKHAEMDPNGTLLATG